MLEIVAKAMYVDYIGESEDFLGPWEHLADDQQEIYFKLARSAIAAIQKLTSGRIGNVAKAITRFSHYPSDEGWYVFDMHAWVAAQVSDVPPPIFEMIGTSEDAERRRDELNAREAIAAIDAALKDGEYHGG
jgi:hypothetical protein